MVAWSPWSTEMGQQGISGGIEDPSDAPRTQPETDKRGCPLFKNLEATVAERISAVVLDELGFSALRSADRRHQRVRSCSMSRNFCTLPVGVVPRSSAV